MSTPLLLGLSLVEGMSVEVGGASCRLRQKVEASSSLVGLLGFVAEICLGLVGLEARAKARRPRGSEYAGPAVAGLMTGIWAMPAAANGGLAAFPLSLLPSPLLADSVRTMVSFVTEALRVDLFIGLQETF